AFFTLGLQGLTTLETFFYARTFHIFFYFSPYFLTLLAQNITFARAIHYYIAAFFGLFTYLF
ncbi:hypothetical protein, partial [uncultured Prevotella sp.]|uniref:hypothetical protein n=1 Tax=uncultured Prevotella sp. TaxID=159272 RepID=UPI0027E30078